MLGMLLLVVGLALLIDGMEPGSSSGALAAMAGCLVCYGAYKLLKSL